MGNLGAKLGKMRYPPNTNKELGGGGGARLREPLDLPCGLSQLKEPPVSRQGEIQNTSGGMAGLVCNQIWIIRPEAKWSEQAF